MNMLNFCLSLSAYLFCIVATLDPANNVLGLKIPVFSFFMLCLVMKYKPSLKYMPIIISLILMQVISIFCGTIYDLQIMDSFFFQYLTFFLTLFALLWCKHIDLVKPLKISCVILSIVTIVGYVIMLYYPEVELLLYDFSISHDNIFLMSHRTFLGVDFISFCYKSLPLVSILAGISFYKFVNEDRCRMINLLLFILFAFALFCGGNRALLISILCIILLILYSKYKGTWFPKLVVNVSIVLFIIVAWFAITEKGESSNDVKYRHLESYIIYFSNNPALLLFGGGAGSLFYSKGFMSFTPLTEWTYIEIIRMYGIIGAYFMFKLLLVPLNKYKQKVKHVKYWIPVSIGYVTFLVICGSNPYLINSTGLIGLLFIYSYIENSKYRL